MRARRRNSEPLLILRTAGSAEPDPHGCTHDMTLAPRAGAVFVRGTPTVIRCRTTNRGAATPSRTKWRRRLDAAARRFAAKRRVFDLAG